jgi:PBP1b-binding outer membrane lipoprotein LpoB
MKIIIAAFFLMAVALSACNKKTAPAASNTETNTNNAASEQPAETPQFQKINVVPVYKEFKKINLTNLKIPADTTVTPQENLTQPRPVGAPIEAPPKNP